MEFLTKYFKRHTPLAVVPAPTRVIDTSLRVGTWVRAGERIGILSDYAPHDSMEVTFTKADGTNLMTLVDEQVVPHREVFHRDLVRRAVIADIPRNRYETVEQLRALGYGDY